MKTQVGRYTLAGLLLMAGLLLIAFFYAPQITTATTPTDFVDSKVVDTTDSSNLASPTALAFTPDGRMLITTQPGKLMIYQSTGLVTTPALTFPGTKICSNGERGLLGIAVDPNYAANGYIYVYYTFNRLNSCSNDATNSPVNRVSRFTLPPGSDTINIASELVLLDHIPSLNSNHNGGDLHFGPTDGYLYVSVGDSGCQIKSDGSGDTTKCAGGNANATTRSLILGKILRIKTDGTIPPENPLASDSNGVRCANPANSGIYQGTGLCQEMFAWGLRNPFRFGFKPGTSQFYINDVGQGIWEEIDNGQINANYGWNVREGHCANGSQEPCSANPAGLTPPIFDYNHNTGCASITGGAFVPNDVFGASYNNSYLYADYVCGKIFKLTQSGSTFTSTEFASNLGGLTTLSFGPYQSTQALYYLSYAGGGEVRRIHYAPATNHAPYASLTASPTNGPTPLTVNFDGSASFDPDAGNTIAAYLWDFGNGITRTTTIATTSYTYSATGIFTATLRARDNYGATSDPASIRLGPGNTPPVPVINPTMPLTFAVGQNLTLTGSATDTQDGPIPPYNLSWQVLVHHIPFTTPATAHTHPFLGPVTGSAINFSAPTPEDLDATTLSYLEVKLTAIDSFGVSATVTKTISPRKVNMKFVANPTSASVVVNGDSFTNQKTYVSWENWGLVAQALTQDAGGGNWLVINNWSINGTTDSGPFASYATRTIITPSTPVTYTANFLSQACNPVSITIMTDNLATPYGCGSLRYALASAPGGEVITLPGDFLPKDTLTVGRGLTIQGATCGSAPVISPDPTLNSAPKDLIVLQGGAILRNLTVQAPPTYSKKPVVTNATGSTGGGKFTGCVTVKRT